MPDAQDRRRFGDDMDGAPARRRLQECQYRVPGLGRQLA